MYLHLGFELLPTLDSNIFFLIMFCLFHSVFFSFTLNPNQNTALSHLLAKRYLASKYLTLKGHILDSLDPADFKSCPARATLLQPSRFEDNG